MTASLSELDEVVTFLRDEASGAYLPDGEAQDPSWARLCLDGADAIERTMARRGAEVSAVRGKRRVMRRRLADLARFFLDDARDFFAPDAPGGGNESIYRGDLEAARILRKAARR